MPAILLGHFYKIDSLLQDGNGVTARITFDADHSIYDGHFPDMPIVPGVCQAQMLGEILSKAVGSDMQLKSAASIKFLSVVDPSKTPSLDLTITSIKNEHGTYNVSSQYKWEETVFFKFKGIYASTQ